MLQFLRKLIFKPKTKSKSKPKSKSKSKHKSKHKHQQNQMTYIQLKNLSGCSIFSFYHQLDGKKILLLGDMNDTTGKVCEPYEYMQIYEVEDWLYYLSINIPEQQSLNLHIVEGCEMLDSNNRHPVLEDIFSTFKHQTLNLQFQYHLTSSEGLKPLILIDPLTYFYHLWIEDMEFHKKSTEIDKKFMEH